MPAPGAEPQTNATDAPRLFDVRLLIAAIMGLYGVILTVMGLGASTQSLRKADGIRINLWVGLGMLIVGGLFLLWSLRRPLRLPPPDAAPDTAER